MGAWARDWRVSLDSGMGLGLGMGLGHGTGPRAWDWGMKLVLEHGWVHY